jgi:zinc protease
MKRNGSQKKLRSLLIVLLIPILVWFTNVLPAAAQAKHYTELTFPALPEVKIPNYTKFKLNNGMTVFLMEDHDFPLVSGTMYVRTGERLEPADKTGLASIMAEVMRTGGTQQYPPDVLNEFLEQRAAAIEVGIDEAAATANFSTVSEDLPAVFDRFAAVIRSPAFPQDKIDLAKTTRRGNISRRNDRPDSISGREFSKLIYGSASPYARSEEYDTIKAIRREDLQSFYARSFQPTRAMLGIVGDFKPQQMKQLIEKSFGNWPANKMVANDPLPNVNQAKQGGIYIADQPQLTQSSVLIGQLGGKLSDPDVFALFVMNEVLNSFGGRLFNEIRSRQGLAYSVYALWNTKFDYPGTFVAGGQTRSETTVPFIQSVKNELKKLQQAPLTPNELAFAKESILNSFVFNFVEPSQTLARLMRYEYFGYPNDFIFKYQRAVKEMTADKVLQAAKRNLKPDQMVTLVVGSRQSIQPTLETLKSPVTALDIKIPAESIAQKNLPK